MQDIIKEIVKDEKYSALSAILMATDMEYNEKIGSAGVNGLSMLIAESFLSPLNKGQKKLLLLHELMHIACKHEFIYKEEFKNNPQLINMAADFWINQELLGNDSTLEMIPNGCHDPAQYGGKTVLEIYEMLKKNPPPKRQGGGMGDCFGNPDEGDDEGDGKPKTPEQLQAQLEKMDAATTMARIDAILAGQEAGTLLQKIKDAGEGRADWRKIMMRKIATSLGNCKKISTWKNPNKKIMSSTGIYMPSSKTLGIKKINIYVDISGSMSEQNIKDAIADIRSIEKNTKSNIDVYTFDTKVYEPVNIKQFKQIDYFGGGTTLKPILESIDKTKPTISVILTDGCFGDGEVHKRKGVIWLVDEGRTVKCIE